MNEHRVAAMGAESDQLESSVWESAIDRSEACWLEIVEYLLLQLTSIVGTRVQLGPYWIGSGPNGASFCCRLRSDDFPYCPADTWEGSLCISSNQERSWLDLEVFPFLQGKRVAPGQLWWFQYERLVPDSPGRWVSRGWRSDEYGEWESIEEPGDAFQGADTPIPDAVSFTALKPRLALAEPKLIRVQLMAEPLEFGSRLHSQGITEPASLSLYAVRRAGQKDNPIGHSRFGLPQGDDPVLRTVVFRDRPERVVDVDLEAYELPGGWVAGRYEVVLRVRRLSNDEGSSLSYLSPPIAVEIGES